MLKQKNILKAVATIMMAALIFTSVPVVNVSAKTSTTTSTTAKKVTHPQNSKVWTEAEKSAEELKSHWLPNCPEGAALSIELNIAGIECDQYGVTFSFLPQKDIYTKGGKTYGYDMNEYFMGSPYKDEGYGCTAKCLVKAWKNFAKEDDIVKRHTKAENLSGKDFYELLDDKLLSGSPVLCITTKNLENPIKGKKWYLKDGTVCQSYENHDAMIIYGFDYKKDEIYVLDPLAKGGKAVYSLKQFKKIYNKMGKSAMIIDCWY